MARVDKLKIQGIRSFGPGDDDSQTIVFFSPLTCFVGANGCGKTTIIESLRFATTGNAPPSTAAGKTFVYDPKLTTSGEVKGQVKLQFVNLKGEKMMVSRTLQVTQRLTELKLKTIEPSLNMLDSEGQVQTIGGRCADIDKLVLSNLGLSKAILDNVIFCHQEDSLWPLDEGKKVKEKFDEIFDASKYNKASDGINSLQKKKKIELAQGRTKLGFLLERHHEARDKRNALALHIAKHADANAEMEILQKKRKPLMEKYEDIRRKEDDYTNLKSQISFKEAEKRGLEEQQQELREKIKDPHEGSKEELKRIMENFNEQLKKKKDEIAELEGQVARLRQQEKDGLDRINQEQTRLGKLQQEEENHKEKIQLRNQCLNDLAKDLKLHGLVGEEPKTSDEMENALRQVESGARARDKELQNLKKAQQLEEQNLQENINQKREKRAEVNEKVKTLDSQRSECENQLREIKSEINKVEKEAAQIHMLRAKLQQADQEFDDLQGKINVDDTQSQISDTQNNRKKLELEIQVLDNEVEILQEASSIQTEVDVHTETLANKEAALTTLKAKRHDDLMLLFNTIPQRGLQAQLEASIKQNERDIKDLRNRLEKEQKQHTKMESDVKHLRRKVNEAEELLQKNLSEIKKECGNKDFDTLLLELDDARRKTQDEKGVLDSSEILFRRYITSLKQKDPCCPLCHRDFKAIREIEKLVDELQGKMQSLPVRKDEVKTNLEDLKVRYERLLQLKPAQAEVADLRVKKIPKLKEELETAQMLMDTASAECEMLTDQLKGPVRKLEVAMDLRSDAALIEQYEMDMKKIARDIQSLEARLPRTGTGRSLQEARDELKQLRNEVQTLQRDLEAKQNELDAHQKKISEAREKRNAIKEELLQVQSGAQKRAQLIQRSEELSKQVIQLMRDLEEAQKAMDPANEAVKTAEREIQHIRNTNNETLEQKRKELSHIQNQIGTLKYYHSAVESYEARDIPAKLEALKSSVRNHERERERFMTKGHEIRSRIEELNTEIAKHEVKEREMHDSLKLLEKQELCERVMAELRKLKAQIGNMDCTAMLRERSKLEREIQNIDMNVNKFIGSQESLAAVIKDLEKELEKDILKHAESRYKTQLVKNEVMEHVIKDLSKYFNALYQAMIHFHRERMESINRIIRELWVQIYKGSDIDYIAIRTDADQPTTASKATNRRTYNYRVVMIKRDAELDMRGRCSAGQKMLASLVIRIALAETFSATCGILALDEPTTNLDHDNIDSLCNALVELARNHRFQNNFQLIVITHDENFINQLTQAGLVQHFYKVARNEEAHSTVKKFRVGDLD